ncbi:MAG: ribosome-associated translation inhibitor RaiA [Oscillospiraceae bacterium]|nr:ribosome-associated translation inhibitor RaiA [Oscillospiraceae bacterium]
MKKLNIMAKKIQIGPSFSEYAEKKLNQRLDKFFEDEAEAKITLTEQRGQIVCELTVRAGSMIYRAEQSAVDKNDALDAAIDKIIRKIRRNKTKLGKRIKEGALSAEAFTDSVEEQTEYHVIRRKTFQLHPMSVEEAILQMNMLGHSFFLFTNGENGSFNVVYRREDGDYAVLEPTTE